MTARRHVLGGVLAVLSLVVAACTGADDGVASPASSDVPAVAVASPTPGEASSTLSTPQQAVLAAYERYTAATVDAMAAGEADPDQLRSVAGDQALRHVRRRVRANRRDDVVVTGTLETSARVEDVELRDARTATVTDCVLNDLEQVAADDPGTTVTQATGWRQPVQATVERRDGRWVVTRVKVPLRDGSGRVPPPPDDPPYLRGPAQGPAPPSCVPDALATQAVAAYEAFRDAYDTALGYGRSGPADPDLPALEATAVDPQLSGAREFAAELERDERAFRGEPSTRDPWAVAALNSDRKVIVYDCVTVGAGGLAAVRDTKPASEDVDAGMLRLDAAGVVSTAGGWKVSGWEPIEEGLERCSSPTQ